MFPGAREMPRLDGPPPPLLDVHALRHIVPSSTAGSPRSRAASPSQNTRHQKRAAEQIADWLRDSERLKELQRRAADAMRQADAVERARRAEAEQGGGCSDWCAALREAAPGHGPSPSIW